MKLKELSKTWDLIVIGGGITGAGIRPVLSEGKLKPSEESREHVVWIDKGLITVTGGKLTTFRRLAWDALKAAGPFLPPDRIAHPEDPVFEDVPPDSDNGFGLAPATWRRLYGRYGMRAEEIIQGAAPDDLDLVPGTHTLWAELPHAAQHEQIRHLEDLLLRRVRIGLLTPKGGKAHLNRVKSICKNVLPWDRWRWETEIQIYKNRWNQSYNLPQRRAERHASRTKTYFRVMKSILYEMFHEKLNWLI